MEGDDAPEVLSSLPDVFRADFDQGVPEMAKASPRPHRAALTRMLRHTGLGNVPEEAPLVELLRTLADELDNGGGSRPRIEYRAALKDARMVLNTTVRGRPKTDPTPAAKTTPEVPVEGAEGEELDEPTSLALFKQERGIS